MTIFLFDVSGVIDNSGIRMRLTSQLRQHDVGSLVVGHDVSSYQVIPPQQAAFISKGFCSENCINKVKAFFSCLTSNNYPCRPKLIRLMAR